MNREKLMKMAGSVRTGGKGSVRRKKKAVHKTTTTDDKKLQSTLKRLGVNTIPGIEEVNIFKDDTVINFSMPKVQASIPANTYVISGPSQNKKLEEMLPGIWNQLGADNLQRLAQQVQGQAAAAAAAAGKDDDDVPEVEDFEEESNE
mmetsp:Transcript_9647/g.35345  ORF Transcript_9647/g.35345 Transcript_9647/m.35345 type:complete len:147 (+) Transcript_9647:120-560(+)